MTAIPPTLPTTAPATTGGDVLLSLGLLVPLRAPLEMAVADPTPPAPATDGGVLAVELELGNAVDDGKAGELEERSEDDESSRLELEDEIEGEDDK